MPARERCRPYAAYQRVQPNLTGLTGVAGKVPVTDNRILPGPRLRRGGRSVPDVLDCTGVVHLLPTRRLQYVPPQDVPA